MNKVALVTGITGQDGYYMSKLLLEKDYKVYGMVRRTTQSLGKILLPMTVFEGDLTDQSSLDRIVKETEPDEVYNFAAQSFVPTSFTHPVMTADVTGLGVTRLLEAIRKYRPEARFYQASSSEMFGNSQQDKQNEETPLNPQSPYGAAKVYAHLMTKHYRKAYGLFTSCGISFNHESERRGPEFVTRKITLGVARIKKEGGTLEMGSPFSQRDWGHAEDYVRGMWMALQADQPDDYVFATGETHSIQEFASHAFREVGLDYTQHVVWGNSPRPSDVHALCGDSSKARAVLGWEPKVRFEELVHRMVVHDLDLSPSGV